MHTSDTDVTKRAGADKSSESSAANEGEGNKTADRNYREATRKFVESERGKAQIRKAGDVKPGDAREIEQAEEEGKRHAKR